MGRSYFTSKGTQRLAWHTKRATSHLVSLTVAVAGVARTTCSQIRLLPPAGLVRKPDPLGPADAKAAIAPRNG